MKDIIVLVADKNMEFLIKGLFPRIPRIENIPEFSFDVLVHQHRDAGVFNESDEFLRSFHDKYDNALVIFDHSGCGREDKTREELELLVENKINRSGWNENVCAIVINPEIENWIWVNEARLKDAISWEDENGVYDWLYENGWIELNSNKPNRPKEAFQACLRKCQIPRSSSIYKEISSKASYRVCQDPAFQKMIEKLKSWFSQVHTI
jgi:hypothetical protein